MEGGVFTMDNSNSGLTAADVLALTKNGSAGCDMLGGSYFWWVIIFFIIAKKQDRQPPYRRLPE